MSDTVFILGAGASVDVGGPLMKDFLNRAQDLHAKDRYKANADFRRVFCAHEQLQRFSAKSSFDPYNIEDVFGAFEMAAWIGRLGSLTDQKEIAQLPNSMREVIRITLENNVYLRKEQGWLKSGAWTCYNNFAKMLASLSPKPADRRKFSIITFNYDVALDFALALNEVSFHYGFGHRPSKHSIPLLKLHGSLNWTRCKGECEQRVVILMEKICDELLRNKNLNECFHLPVCEYFRASKCPNCMGDLEMVPSIIPPIFDKSEYRKELKDVWIGAVNELGTARNIFVCGYSLPRTDNFFRYLFSLGTLETPLLRRFVVIDPDTDVHGKFRDLLSQHVAKRKDIFVPYKWTFANALSDYAANRRDAPFYGVGL